MIHFLNKIIFLEMRYMYRYICIHVYISSCYGYIILVCLVHFLGFFFLRFLIDGCDLVKMQWNSSQKNGWWWWHVMYVLSYLDLYSWYICVLWIIHMLSWWILILSICYEMDVTCSNNYNGGMLSMENFLKLLILSVSINTSKNKHTEGRRPEGGDTGCWLGKHQSWCTTLYCVADVADDPPSKL